MQVKMLIDGSWVGAERTIDVENPGNGEVLGQIPIASPEYRQR